MTRNYTIVREGDNVRIVNLNMDNTSPMIPEKVDILLDEVMGIGNPEIREATKQYCLNSLARELEDIPDSEERITVGAMNSQLWNFVEGYEACLKTRS